MTTSEEWHLVYRSATGLERAVLDSHSNAIAYAQSLVAAGTIGAAQPYAIVRRTISDDVKLSVHLGDQAPTPPFSTPPTFGPPVQVTTTYVPIATPGR